MEPQSQQSHDTTDTHVQTHDELTFASSPPITTGYVGSTVHGGLEETTLAQDVKNTAPYFTIFAGLAILTAATYGFLTWSEPTHAVETHTAAAATTVQEASPYESLKLEAQSAFVVDLTRNKIVYEQNADVQLPLASITKVALVLAVAPVLGLDEVVTISNDAVVKGQGGMVAGDTWRVRDLIAYTLLASSNAGAEALAEVAHERIRARYPQAPETDATVWRMNQLARELGLSKTYYLNASGLDVSPTQTGAMSSAREATILLAYAYKTSPDLFVVTKNPTLETGPLSGPSFVAENTNDALGSIAGLKMGKTGFTDLAGGNLGIVYEVNGKTMAATVMGSSKIGRFADVVAITDISNETTQQ